MNARDSIFGAEPERLRQLIRSGMDVEDVDAEDPPPASGSVGGVMERPGTQIGCYKLLHILGEGGMGVVYLAEQEHLIRRRVALKIIKPGMDSRRVLARFDAERQALALLDHPNIAHVYDAGMTAVGRPYFVMEYVKGSPITEYCDHHKLSIEDRLALFVQVCDAVQHAHQKGIIHRDIKPSNILVSVENDRPTPKIIDFGVAKAIGRPLTDRTLFTEDSHLLGTPEYMSPEQADMASEDIDTRSDVYSLGVLLYVLLTGVLPFDPQTLRGSGIENVRKTIRETDPKTPSTRLTSLGQEAAKIAGMRGTEIRTLARRLKKELEWIPLKAMRKERSQRYRSASELADDIENYLKGAPLVAAPPGIGYKVKKFVRRNRVLVGGIAAVLVVLFAGVVVSAIFAVGQARARAEAEAVSDFLRNDVLGSMNPRETMSAFAARGREATVRSFLDTASERLEDKFPDKPLVEASIRQTLGTTYMGLGQYKSAESHLKRAIEVYRAQLGANDPATLACTTVLGLAYFWRSRYSEAEPLLADTTEGLARVLGPEHPDTLFSMSLLGWVCNVSGSLDEAQRLFIRGLETSRRVFGKEDQNTGGFEYGLAFALHRRADYAEAERLYNRGLAIYRHVRGEEDLLTLEAMNFLGELYQELGRYDEAERLHEKVLQVRDRILGPQHPDTLRAKAELSRLRIRQGRYEEAELLLDGSVNATEVARHDDDSSASMYTMFTLAELYFLQERYDEAEQLIVPVLETRRAVFGEEHWRTLSAITMLAKLYAAQGRYDEAEERLIRARETSRRVLGKEHPLMLDALNALAVVRSKQKHHDEAENLFAEALKGRKLKLGDDHPDTLESKNDLAAMYKEQGRYDEAELFLLETVKGRLAKLGDTHPHTKESLNELIDLYKAWNKPEKANKWRLKLSETEAARE